MVKTISNRLFSGGLFNRRDKQAIKTVLSWSMMLLVAFVLFGCEDEQSSTEAERIKACEQKQVDYENNYIAEFGTLEGYDPYRYTYNTVSNQCITNQGVEG